MCGIAGVYKFGGTIDPHQFESQINCMTDAIAHRGPNSRGVWLDLERGISLGHRRLAIRDLSENGHQPMISSCGRFVIVYNGEIYSHKEMTIDLAKCGRTLRGGSDTEVILEACAEWGVNSAVKRLIGMFAFALYDRETQELSLVRDRLGIKPLYWGLINNLFLFGSELKALRTVGGWSPKLDRNSLASFMRHNYIPAPHTIYQNIYKLEPGSILKILPYQEPRINKYWSMQDIMRKALMSPLDGSEESILNELDRLLSDSVSRRMVADVPLGSLLSGGIDSSLVTALMVENSERQISTFSIGFGESGYDEAPYAREIAKHLGTNHTELYVNSRHALDLVGKMPYMYDEPFADSSQIPTAIVCELTKQHVTVVLSGDGGDEFFAGYNRYAVGLQMWQKAKMAPHFSRKLLARFLLAQPTDRLEYLGALLPASITPRHLGIKLHKFAQAILQDSPDEMYLRMLSHWQEPNNLVIGASEYRGVLWDRNLRNEIPNFLDRMQFLDSITYLPDDILTKVDRASMMYALEARVPLLDHRVVEMSWRLPRNMKVRNGESKWALRQLLYKRIPRELIDRPKMGFGIPLGDWIRGPLRGWGEELINESRLEEQGLFNAGLVREKWNAHLAGENWGYPLWNVLMVQAWLEVNKDVSLS